MGAICKPNNLSLTFLEDFRLPYPYVNKDFKFREMEVYEHQIDAQFKILKLKNFGTYFHVREQRQLIESRLGHAHIINLHRSEFDTITYSLYIDFPTRLDELVQARLKDEEIWEMLNHVTRGCAFLQEQKLRYKSVNPKGIYKVYNHTQEFAYKLSDVLFTETRVEKYFLGPDLFYNHYDKVTNMFKQDVFSLGLVVVYCLGFKDTQKYYKQNSFDYEGLVRDLDIQKPSTQIRHILSQIITPEEQDRPDFIMLRTSLKNLSKAYNCSVKEIKYELFADQKLKSAIIPDLDETDKYQYQEPEKVKKKVVQNMIPTRLAGHIPYTNGCYYVGEYKENSRKREGVGIFFDSQGHKLIDGTFINDLPDGDDIQLWRYDAEQEVTHLNLTDFDYYRGQMSQGMKQGRGFLKFANGNTFEGFFMDDKAAGSGKYYYKNQVIEGVWMDDKFVY